MRTAIVSDLHLGSNSREGRPPRPLDQAHPAGRDRGRRPGRPARRHGRDARSPTGRGAGGHPSVLRGAGRDDGRAPDPDAGREPRPPAGGPAARPARNAGHQAPRPRDPLCPSIGTLLTDCRLAGAGRAGAVIPRCLAARGRLRDARALHGLPPHPAPGRVHRQRGGGAGDAATPGSRRSRGLRAVAAAALRARLRPCAVRRSKLLGRISGTRGASLEVAFRDQRPFAPAPDRRRGDLQGCRPGGDLDPESPTGDAVRARPLRRRDQQCRDRRGQRGGAAAANRRRARDRRPQPPGRASRGGGALAAGRRRPAPQHRQLDLRLGLSPAGLDAGALLAGDGHLAARG